MKRFVKLTLIVLLVIFVAIQFIPADLPENRSDNPDDIIAAGVVDEEVSLLLKTSCYDCHSNAVKYPWYSYVAPVKFLVSHDVKEGKDELNFSEFMAYPKRRMIKKLDEIGEVIEEGEMPLPIYTALHSDAKLTEDDKAKITAWASGYAKSMLK